VDVIIDAGGVFPTVAAREAHHAARGAFAAEVGPPPSAEVAAAESYLELCTPTSRATCPAYGVKRWAEEWLAWQGRRVQVSYAALILAAVRLGLLVDLRDHGPGCGIGISRRSAARMSRGR
jgi:hypothetical protein